jgi:hypothetical protein
MTDVVKRRGSWLRVIQTTEMTNDLVLSMPFHEDFSFQASTKFEPFPVRFGGVVSPRPHRIVTIVELPVPQAPGVEAMLADGWRWDGWGRFAKRLPTDWTRHSGNPEKYSSFIHEKRVVSGRYAERLPTNRARKRVLAKQRRKARRA